MNITNINYSIYFNNHHPNYTLSPSWTSAGDFDSSAKETKALALLLWPRLREVLTSGAAGVEETFLVTTTSCCCFSAASSVFASSKSKKRSISLLSADLKSWSEAVKSPNNSSEWVQLSSMAVHVHTKIHQIKSS